MKKYVALRGIRFPLQVLGIRNCSFLLFVKKKYYVEKKREKSKKKKQVVAHFIKL